LWEIDFSHNPFDFSAHGFYFVQQKDGCDRDAEGGLLLDVLMPE